MADLKSSSKLAKCKHYCRVFFTHLFSHVGLCSLVVGYSIVGALTFEWLESKYEMDQKSSIQLQRMKVVDDLWNITDTLNVFDEVQWKQLVEEKLGFFEKDVVHAVKNDGYDGWLSDSQWSFSSSLLYCITVITTIGYGNMTPKTNSGRAVTVFYALIGIPLMLLCLSNIGDLLARSFKFAYYHLKVLFRNPGRHTTIHSQQQFCKEKKVGTGKTVVDGSLDMSCNDEKSLKDGSSPISSPSKNNSVVVVHEARPVVIESVYSLRDDEDSSDQRVPMSLVLVILTAYICGGGLMFSLWEKWSFLDGTYFCFITLSTIGFGDLMPGSNSLDTSDGPAKLISCCLYLILGLAIIAMSFNLVQEEVTIKCRNLAHNLGFLKSDKGDED